MIPKDLPIPICLVGRKAIKRGPCDGVMDRRRPLNNPSTGTNHTAIEAEHRRVERNVGGSAEPEIIGYSSDSGARLVAMVFNPAIFT